MALTLNTPFGNVDLLGNSSEQTNQTQGLSKFTAFVRENGLASHNRYFVTFDIPRALQNVYGQFGGVISLLCAGGEFPATSIEGRDMFTFGPLKPYATNVRFNDMFLFFYLDTAMNMKKFVDDWMNLIVSPVDGIVAYNDDYSTNIRIFQLDKNDVPTYGVQLIKVWPKSTYPLQITYQGSALHRLPVSFSYQSWQKMDVTYTADQTGFWGNLMSTMGVKILNKVAPVIYGILA
jgi:hypothetical protein